MMPSAQSITTPEPITDGGIAVCGCSFYDSDDGVACWRCEEVIGSRVIPAGVWRSMVERAAKRMAELEGHTGWVGPEQHNDAAAILGAALGVSA